MENQIIIAAEPENLKHWLKSLSITLSNRQAFANTAADLTKAREAYHQALKPLPRQAIDALLVEMVVTQAHRNTAGELAQVQLEIYARKLMEWPADCVNAACKKTRQWFPTWAELEADIFEKLGDRKTVYDCLLGGRVRDEAELQAIRDKQNERSEYRKKRERDIARISNGTKPGRNVAKKPQAQKCRPVADQMAELYVGETS